MKCSNCKTDDQDGEFCGFCGADLAVLSTPVTVPVSTPEPASSRTSTEDATAIFAGANAEKATPTSVPAGSDGSVAQPSVASKASEGQNSFEKAQAGFPEVVEEIIEKPVNETPPQSVPFQPVVNHTRSTAGSQTSVTAIASLIAVFIVPILGLILGYLAKREIVQAEGMKTGLGLAKASIILGWIFVGLGILSTLLGVAVSMSQQ